MSKRGRKRGNCKRGLNDDDPDIPDFTRDVPVSTLSCTKNKLLETSVDKNDKRRRINELDNTKNVPRTVEAGSSSQTDFTSMPSTSRQNLRTSKNKVPTEAEGKSSNQIGSTLQYVTPAHPTLDNPRTNENTTEKGKQLLGMIKKYKSSMKDNCVLEKQQNEPRVITIRSTVSKSDISESDSSSSEDFNNSDTESNNSYIEIPDSEDSALEHPNVNQGANRSRQLLSNEIETNPINQHPLSMLQTLIGINPTLKAKFVMSDILLIVLTFALFHNLTYSAMCDIMKTINLLLCTSMFPVATTYFKQMLNLGMQIHYTCEKCSSYLGTQADEDAEQTKTMKCASCDTVNEVEGRFEDEFVLLDVEDQIKDILMDKSCKFISNPEMYTSNKFRDIYDGLKYAVKTRPHLQKPWKFLTCTLFCETAPIPDESNSMITPIYLMINELEFSSRGKNLILAGFWYGKNGKQPQMDVFLKQFVNQMNKLYTDGFEVDIDGEKKQYKVAVICCCVANEMRCKMQGICKPGKLNSCSWCLTKGEVENEGDEDVLNWKRGCYSVSQVPRTELYFKDCCKRFADGEVLWGIEAFSPLHNLHQFDMVEGFIPSQMQLFCQITQQFLNLWLNQRSEGKDYYFGTQDNMKKIDKLISKIKVPKFINVIPVPLSQHENMTPKDLENWLLYFSVPVLKDYLPKKYFKHWITLVNVFSLILQDKIDNGIELKHMIGLLYQFESETLNLYGKEQISYNIHQLLHLSYNSHNWGPTWSCTPYTYQSYVNKLSKIIKTCKGNPNEIVRNYNITRTMQSIVNNHEVNVNVIKHCESIQGYPISKALCIDQKEVLTGKSQEYNVIPGLPANVKYLEYDSIVRDYVTYSKECVKDGPKIDNSYVQLESRKYAQIKNVLCSIDEPKEIYVVIKPLQVTPEDTPMSWFRTSPVKRIIGKKSKIACKLSDIKCVAVHVYIRKHCEYVITVPFKHAIMNNMT